MSIWNQKPSTTSMSEQPPPGNHPAILVAMIDLGTQKQSFQGAKETEVHKIYLVWELTTEKQAGMKDANHVIGRMFTLSLNKKSALRASIEAWRGKAIPDGEDFDLTKIVGQPCMVSVAQNGEYANWEAVAAVPKGLKVPPSQHKPLLWEIGGGDMPDLSWTPYIYGESVTDIIARSPEYQDWKRNGNGKQPQADKEGEPTDVESDQIPF